MVFDNKSTFIRIQNNPFHLLSFEPKMMFSITEFFILYKFLTMNTSKMRDKLGFFQVFKGLLGKITKKKSLSGEIFNVII